MTGTAHDDGRGLARAVTGEGAQRIYRRRFDEADRAAKAAVWRVVVADGLQRWIPPGAAVLDIGCGYGEFLNHVRAARRIGVDINPDSRTALDRGIEFHGGDVRELSFLPDASIDVVFTSNLLEHLPSKHDVELLLGEARRVLKHGGHLIALGPNLRFLPGAYWDFWDHFTPITDRSLGRAARESRAPAGRRHPALAALHHVLGAAAGSVDGEALPASPAPLALPGRPIPDPRPEAMTDERTPRSHLLALREPLAAWGAALFGLWWTLGLHPGPEHEVARLLAWTALAGAALAILWARAVRGRTRWLDAAQALIWFAPPLVGQGGQGGQGGQSAGATAAILLARCLASAALVAAAAGPRATWGSLARALARVDQRVVGIALLAVLLSLGRMQFVKCIAGPELDPSWKQSLGRALLEGQRFGVDLQFTYGPLGYFADSPYEPALYWTKTVAYEIVLRLVCAGFVAVAIARVPGVVERVLCALGALLLPAVHDQWAFLVVTSIGCWYFARPGRGVLHESLGTAVLAVLSLSKFTWLMHAAAVWAIFGLWCAHAHGLRRALRTPAIAAALLLGLWCALGQRALDLPRFVWSSWTIAGAYSAAMGQEGDPDVLRSALVLLVLTGLAAAWNLLRRPFSGRALALSLSICAATFLAFKANFVRPQGTLSFLGFVAVAPFLLSAGSETVARTGLDRLRGLLLLGTRLSIVALAVPAYCGDMPGLKMASHLFHKGTTTMAKSLGTLLELDEQRARIERESAVKRSQVALPRTAARVGREAVDLIGSSQGVLHANDLNWTPRPAFQSYVAFTPALLRANAEFLEGPKAPRFLLHESRTIDEHFPSMADALALQVMSRDYRFLLAEGDYLLLERAPANGEPAREVQIDTEVPLEEWVEIGSTPGRAHLLQLDFERTLKGSLLDTLLRSPPLFMTIEDSRQQSHRFRVIPAMMEAGVFVQPFAVGPAEWREWLTRGNAARVMRVRFSAGQAAFESGCYRPVVRLRLIRADDLVPGSLASDEDV